MSKQNIPSSGIPAPDSAEWLDLSPEEQQAILDPDNTANPIAIRAKAKKSRSVEHDREILVGALMDTPQGRAFLAWLMFDICGVFETTAVASFDSNAMHFREGAKKVGLLINKLALRSSSKQYMVLLDENKDKI